MNQASIHGSKKQSWHWCVVWIDVLQRNTWSKSSFDKYTILKWQSFYFWCKNVENHFRFLKGHICFDNPQERTQLWETDRFTAVREIWEIFNSSLSNMLHHQNIFQLMRYYTQWDKKLPSTIIIPISHIIMVCYWSHWMRQDLVVKSKHLLEVALALWQYNPIHKKGS